MTSSMPHQLLIGGKLRPVCRSTAQTSSPGAHNDQLHVLATVIDALTGCLEWGAAGVSTGSYAKVGKATTLPQITPRQLTPETA